MGWLSRNKEPERFYLLPGMGGRAQRRKHKTSLIWAVIVGLLVSVTVTLILRWLHHVGPGAP
jgi:hypothetical protein